MREIVAASYFGTSAAFSAFTIAFQVPNLLRALVADAALCSAFVPVFTELLEQGRKREAFPLAGAAVRPDPRRAGRDHGRLHPRRAA